jgi:hypothetical protein
METPRWQFSTVNFYYGNSSSETFEQDKLSEIELESQYCEFPRWKLLLLLWKQMLLT